MEAVRRLETEDNVVEIYLAQGAAHQLKILEALPEEIERLDAALVKSEEYLAMKDRNSKAHG